MLISHICMCVPEKTLAALTRHGIEVEAGGFVTTHAADPWHVSVKLIGRQTRRTHNCALHH